MKKQRKLSVATNCTVYQPILNDGDETGNLGETSSSCLVKLSDQGSNGGLKMTVSLQHCKNSTDKTTSDLKTYSSLLSHEAKSQSPLEPFGYTVVSNKQY